MDSIIGAIATISTTDPTDGRGTSMFAKQGRHLAAFLVPMKTEWFVSDGALRQNTDDRFMAKDANAFAARQLPVMAPSRLCRGRLWRSPFRRVLPLREGTKRVICTTRWRRGRREWG
jgi:hypothetical protein